MERSRHAFNEFVELCRAATNNDTVVLRLLQQKYNQANRHFLWSDEFCKLVDEYSARIRNDITNKYVHIRDIVSELKAYKAKPMKQVMPTSYNVTLDDDSDFSVRSDDSMLSKRVKVESDRPNSSASLPLLLQHSSCKFIPLSTMSSNQKNAELDVSECKVVDVMADDTDSRSSFGEGSNSQPMDTIAVPEDVSKETELSAVSVKKSADLAASSNEGLLAAVSDMDTSAELSIQLSSEPEEQCAPGEKAKAKVHAGNNRSEPVALCSKEKPDGGQEKDKAASERRIKYLENLLSRFHDRIKKLEEKELSLEEMDQEDSTYLLIDRYKVRIMKIWNKLCTLKGNSSSTGRELEKPFRFEGTKYPDVNKLISRYVTKYHTFPDYHDIHHIIVRCNQRHSLKLRTSYIDVLAREAFTAVGDSLQKKRVKDFVDEFGCHLTDVVRVGSDPALSDVHLKSKLEENRRIGTSRLDEVMRKFSDLQDEKTGSHPGSDVDGDGEDDSDSQKVSADIEDMLLSADTDDPEDGTEHHESVGELSPAPVAEDIDMNGTVEETLNQHRVIGHVIVPASVAGTTAASAAETCCQSPDARSPAADALSPVIPYLGPSKSIVQPSQPDVVCIDVPPDAASVDQGSDAQMRVTSSTEEDIIGEIDLASETGENSGSRANPVITDADEMIVEDTDASNRIKQTLVSAWQGQGGDTLKSVVKRAVAQVEASHDPVSTSTASVQVSSSQTVLDLAERPCAPSKVSQPRVIGSVVSRSITPPDVPTARVIGQIVCIYGSAPHVSSIPHQSTPTHPTSVASPLVVPVSTTATVTSTVLPTVTQVQTTITQAHHPGASSTARSQLPTTLVPSTTKGRLPTMVVQANYASASSSITKSQNSTTLPPGASVAAKSRMQAVVVPSTTVGQIATTPVQATMSSTSAKSRGSASRRRGARRGPRSCHFAVLRPEELYEISSQIVAEVLQRNRQSSKEDVITCDDDDDNDDVVELDLSESGSPSSCDDVVLVEEPTITSPQAANTQCPTAPSAAGSQYSTALQPTSTISTPVAADPSRKLLLIPSSSHRSVRQTQPSEGSRHEEVMVVDEESLDSISYDRDSCGTASDTTTTRPAPSGRVAEHDDAILICDTPAPSGSGTGRSDTRPPVSESGSMLSHQTSVAFQHVPLTSSDSYRGPATVHSAQVPCVDATNDDVIVVESGSESLISSGEIAQDSGETAQGNSQLSASSSVIILE